MLRLTRMFHQRKTTRMHETILFPLIPGFVCAENVLLFHDLVEFDWHKSQANRNVRTEALERNCFRKSNQILLFVHYTSRRTSIPQIAVFTRTQPKSSSEYEEQQSENK